MMKDQRAHHSDTRIALAGGNHVAQAGRVENRVLVQNENPVGTTGSGQLLQVDPYTLTVHHHYQLGHPITGIAAADGKLWIAVGSA